MQTKSLGDKVASCYVVLIEMEGTTKKRGYLGAYRCVVVVLRANQEVSSKRDDENICSIGGGKCHNLLKMILT